MGNKKIKTIDGIYKRCSVYEPDKYDTYLVKTNYGTYEFALFDINGWHVLGPNSGDSIHPVAWTSIIHTEIKY